MLHIKITSLNKNKYSSVSYKYFEFNTIKYYEDDIIYIIENMCINLKHIYKNQVLTPKICAMILSGDYSTCDSDADITLGEILKYQNHITKEEIMHLIP
jgi:hypothetical protein